MKCCFANDQRYHMIGLLIDQCHDWLVQIPQIESSDQSTPILQAMLPSLLVLIASHLYLFFFNDFDLKSTLILKALNLSRRCHGALYWSLWSKHGVTVARKHSSGKKPWTDLCFESLTLLQVVSEGCLASTAPLMSHKNRIENFSFC